MPIFYGLIAFWFGAIIGSFLNVVVWRIPRGESLSTPPSHCPKCGHLIRPWENIPIISWLCLGGRCSSCHLPISWKYPVGEAAVGILYLAIAWRVLATGMPFDTLAGWFWLAGAMLSAARIDAEHRIVPDKITYSGMAAALVFAVLLPHGRPAIANPADLNCGSLITGRLVAAIQKAIPTSAGVRLAAAADCLAAIALAFLLLGVAYWAGCVVLNARRRRNAQHSDGAKDNGEAASPEREPMGWGDIKLLMMTSAFLGADSCIFILAGGAMLGVCYGIAACIIRNGMRQGAAAREASRRKTRNFSMPSTTEEEPRRSIALGALPFAPFLAVPTLLWMIAGNWLYLLYRIFAAG